MIILINGIKRGFGKKCLRPLIKFIEKKARGEFPSYGLIDSQSVKTQDASEERGIDGGKRVKGHKCHIVVDPLGNLLHVEVHRANETDTKAAGRILERVQENDPRLRTFSGDAGYRGPAVTFVNQTLTLTLHISQGIKHQFVILLKPWIVERTLAWLANFRRWAKDSEKLTATAENWIRISMLKLTLAKCF